MPPADPSYLKLCHLTDGEGFALRLHCYVLGASVPVWVLIATLPDQRYISARVQARDVGPVLGQMANAILDRI